MPSAALQLKNILVGIARSKISKPAWRRWVWDTTLCAVRTADEASDSSGDMGTTARFMMALKSE